MKPTLITIAFIFFFLTIKAQQTDVKNDTTIYETVDQEPMPFGGMIKFHEYLAKNIHTGGISPEEAFGRFSIQMVIEKDGSVSHTIAWKNGKYAVLTKEFERVFQTMPKWKPAMNGNRVVRCKYKFVMNLDGQTED